MISISANAMPSDIFAPESTLSRTAAAIITRTICSASAAWALRRSAWASRDGKFKGRAMPNPTMKHAYKGKIPVNRHARIPPVSATFSQ
ncbi:hypothetical protein D3C84_942640 [compost metagenome]